MSENSAPKTLDLKENLKFACVYFGPEEAEKQRQFLILMDNIHIICLSRDEIDEEIELFKKEKVGVNNRIVLHGDEIVNKFVYAMTSFFPGKEYELSDTPDDPAFEEFVRRSEKTEAYEEFVQKPEEDQNS